LLPQPSSARSQTNCERHLNWVGSCSETPMTMTKHFTPERLPVGAAAKELGAIPKRLEFAVGSLSSLSHISPEKDEDSCVTVAHSYLTEQCASMQPNSLCGGVRDWSPMVPASDPHPPSSVLPQKSTMSAKAAYYASRRRSMPHKDEGNGGGATDSDSSSPDIDGFLTTTLTNSRVDPLSPRRWRST
jgi:hypothetical protein